MQTEIARRFQRGELTSRSSVDELKHIGPYLAERLRATFSPRAAQLTIRVFARRIAPLTIEQLRSKLQRALQNERGNQCVPSAKHGRYHVRDVNDRGWRAMRALVHALANGRDGHGLGAQFAFDHTRLRNPPARGEQAAHVGCVRTRRGCLRAGGAWSNGLCMPTANESGFEGVAPYSGQRRRRGQTVRGDYVVSPVTGARWRRPRSMARLPMQ